MSFQIQSTTMSGMMSVLENENISPPAYNNVCLGGESNDDHTYTDIGASQENYYTELQNKTQQSSGYNEPYEKVGCTVDSLPMQPMKQATNSAVNDRHIQEQGVNKL